MEPEAPQDAVGPAPGLGPLESLVLDCLSRADDALLVRDVAERLNGPWAYTTLMTTLDRLYKKGVATRESRGRAFAYRARLSRTDLSVRALRSAVSGIRDGAGSPEVALAALVDAVESHDPAWLDSLDRLVREKRRALQKSARGEGSR